MAEPNNKCNLCVQKGYWSPNCPSKSQKSNKFAYLAVDELKPTGFWELGKVYMAFTHFAT